MIRWLIRRKLHHIQHWLHWQPIEVVSEMRDNHVWIGARCVVCGAVTGWHRTRF